MTGLAAADVIRLLELMPHPEGGHFRETFRDARTVDGRAISTAIYFLLARGERSHWHRIDAVEVWHYYAGSTLSLQIANEGCAPHAVKLGPDIASGERPQAISRRAISGSAPRAMKKTSVPGARASPS